MRVEDQTHDCGSSRYHPLDPVLFKVGDIVEAAFSFIAVPIKNGKFKLYLHLRALTLISTEVRLVGAASARQSIQDSLISETHRYRIRKRAMRSVRRNQSS